MDSITDFLLTIRPKARLDADEATRLRSIAAQNPCHLEANLMLLDKAWQHQYTDAGFAKWPRYLGEIIGRAAECWTAEQLGKIYFYGSVLHYNDEDDTQALEMARAAYEQTPQDISVLRHYMDLAIRELNLPKSEIEPLAGQVARLTPQDDPTEQFLTAQHFEQLWRLYADDRYRALARQCYQRAIELDELEPSLAQSAGRALQTLADAGV